MNRYKHPCAKNSYDTLYKITGSEKLMTKSNGKKLKRKGIYAVREMLKKHIPYNWMSDGNGLVDRINEVQYYTRKIQIYNRYDATI